ncbi:MAG: PucR family transcriptional regulator [Firmicutes bacterium]|nr:PucR family transcriptional regulator [Bacillota bacterium]
MMRQNGISLNEILKMDCMKKSKIIAGLRGTMRTVSKVNVMADPDILNWVDEGELLLTTAYSMNKDNVEEQKKLIKECANKKLAGIGIKVYPYLEKLSDEVIQLANELNFPIIDLHYSTPFSDIMTPIFKEIFNKQARLLQRLEKIHERLMNAMLSGPSIEKISRIIYENLHNPVYIRLDIPKFSIKQFKCINETTKEQITKNIENFYSPNFNKRKVKKFDERSELINGKCIKRMVMPIVVENEVYGHIFSFATNNPLGGFDLSILESASTTIALEVLKKLTVREVENRYKSEFLEDLISLNKNRRQKAVERAESFRLNIDTLYSIGIINIKSNNEERMTIDAISNYINKIINSIEKIMEDVKLKGVVASKTESINILLSIDENLVNKKVLDDFKRKVEQLLKNRFKDAEFTMGVGRAYKGITKAYKSHIDAEKAIRAGRMLDDQIVIDFDKLGIFKILCQDDLNEELLNFYNTTLKPLVDYDNKKSTELVKTLESYYEHNGNLKKMSDSLFTHYNTVLYRVQRIKDITELNLDNANDRLSLEIALKIKRLLGIKIN